MENYPIYGYSGHIKSWCLYQISKDIEQIRKDFDHFSTGFYKLKVNTYNSKDREEKKRFFEEQFQNIPKKEDPDKKDEDINV